MKDEPLHPEDADLDDGSEKPTAPAPAGIEHTLDDAPATQQAAEILAAASKAATSTSEPSDDP